ncbi:phosphotransferase family protein [Halosimplex salinum]|uniref:phosphotransferase family protein n=1 Tax=Halosimplex salinum TaxID=1710538 RepID=UPI000F467C02|nr:phosphotransferase [Halosimplex salinum]
MTDELETTLEPVLDAAFPGRAVAEIGTAGVSWNHQNETARVEFADGEALYLKTAVDGNEDRAARECAVSEYVDAHYDVAVPSVVTTGTAAGRPYIATEPMDARNFADGWWERDTYDQARAIRRVGAALAALHAREFDRHGHVVGGGADGLVLDEGSWTDVLVDLVDAQHERAATDRFEHYVDEVAAAVEANRDRLGGTPAALVHGDPAHPNLFDDGARIGFVDWERAHVGDPARELNRAEKQMVHDDTDRIRTALREGYTDRAGSLPDGFEARKPVYDAVWHLVKLGSFETWVEKTDEHPEEAAESAAAEMERLLDAVR